MDKNYIYLLKRNLKLLSWFNFFTDFVFFAPVAIIYFGKVTGSVTLGMSIFSVAYVASALFEVPTGVISDLAGRKKTMVLGAICATLAIAFYAVGINYWWLILGAVLQGLSRSFYSGNNDAFLHDTLSESGELENFHSQLGKTSSMFQAALASASLLGGFMAAYSFGLVMWASVVPQVLALILATQMTEPKRHKEKESTNIFEHLNQAVEQFRKNRKLRFLTIGSVLRFSLGESAYFLRSAFVNMLWPLWAVGVAQTISNFCGALSFYFSDKVINKFGAFKVLNFEIISNRVVNLIALVFPTSASPILMSSTSITFGAGSVATGTLLQKEFSANQRATMGSLNSFAGSLGFGFLSMLLGIIADMTSIRVALILANILLLLPLYFYKQVFRDKKNFMASA